MTSEQVKNLAVNSSKIYYNFLSETGRGVEEIKVVSISQKRETFKLKLDKKLFSLDSMEFVVVGEKINTERIKVILYDNDTNTLLIKPQPTLQEQFNKLLADEIKIISDLKFLVKRTEDWYELNGEKICLPTSKSSLGPPTENEFFPDMQPSLDQKEGINTIFNQPLSYVWGAPGTGKTQLVLAYSLIHYIRAGKKVAIFAATNNALEQVLYGVFNMTRKAGIDDNKILRLGTPSGRFAQAHPESCEAVGVQQRSGEIDNQIKIVKDVIESRKTSQAIDAIDRESQSIFSQLKNLEDSREELFLAVKSCERDIETELVVLDRIFLQISELEKSIKRKEKIVASFFYALKMKFTKNVRIETELDEERMKLQAQLRQYKAQETMIRELEEKFNDLKSSYGDISKAEEFVEDLKKICISDDEARIIVSKTSFQNYESVKDSLGEYIERKNADLEPAQIIAPEYDNWTEQELLKKLGTWEGQKARLESETEERIKDANVIALTLDCYVGRYKDKDLPSEHYFLDEAGYASLIKALTLFKKNVPITFLGDHMQLPPVCEFDDRRMKDSDSGRDVFMWAQSALYIEWIFEKNREEAFQDYYANTPYVFNEMKRVDLKHTYRFGSALARKLNEFVYNNGFSAHGQNGETEIYYIHAPHLYPQPLTNFNGRNAPSRENAFEVSKIVELFDDLDRESFAILTPYKKQVALLGRALPEARREQKIMTVHGSQGKEWNDVVLSVVDTDRMWFVDTLNQSSRGMNVLNTAVSRAKKRLFIVCNYNFWIRQDKQLLKGLLDVAKPRVR